MPDPASSPRDRNTPAGVRDTTAHVGDNDPVTSVIERQTEHASDMATTRVDVDEWMEWLVRQRFRETATGYAFTRVALNGTPDQAIALAVLVRAALSGSSR